MKETKATNCHISEAVTSKWLVFLLLKTSFPLKFRKSRKTKHFSTLYDDKTYSVPACSFAHYRSCMTMCMNDDYIYCMNHWVKLFQPNTSFGTISLTWHILDVLCIILYIFPQTSAWHFGNFLHSDHHLSVQLWQ